LYNTLLEGFAKVNDSFQVDHLLNTMLLSGIKPSCFTLTFLVKFFGRSHRLERVFEMLDTVATAYHVEKDAYVYTSLIAACVWNEDIWRAAEYLIEMQSKFPVSGRTYGTVIQGCLKCSADWSAFEKVLIASLRKRIKLGQKEVVALDNLRSQFQTHLSQMQRDMYEPGMKMVVEARRREKISQIDLLDEVLAIQPTNEQRQQFARDTDRRQNINNNNNNNNNRRIGASRNNDMGWRNHRGNDG